VVQNFYRVFGDAGIRTQVLLFSNAASTRLCHLKLSRRWNQWPGNPSVLSLVFSNRSSR